MIMNRYNTTKEIAEIIGVNQKTLRRLIITAGLPYINVGTASKARYRFDLDAVKEFLDKRRGA